MRNQRQPSCLFSQMEIMHIYLHMVAIAQDACGEIMRLEMQLILMAGVNKASI